MSNQNGQTNSNLIVNYLPQAFTDIELNSLFSTIGQIESCRVMKDFNTGYSFGFGFVNYVRPEDADRAIKKLNGTEIFGKRIKVSFARPSGDEIKDTNLYVMNLPKHYTDPDLEALFSEYGTIVQKNLLMDKITGLPRGVAFVRYNKREEAQEAIKHLNGLIPEGGNERLLVKIAEEHGKQKAAYFAGWHAGYQQSRGQGDSVRGGRGNSRGWPASVRGGPIGIQGGRGGPASVRGGRGGPASVRGGRGGPASVRGGPASVRGGRASFYEWPDTDYDSRPGDHDSNINNNFVSYPLRNNGFGPIRQEKMEQRYNPLGFGVPNNRYTPF